MHIRRSQPEPKRRQVQLSGRATAFTYHSRRSEVGGAFGRGSVLHDSLNARSAAQVARYWRQRFGLLIVLIAIGVGLYQLIALSSDPKVLPVDGQATFLHPLSAYHDTAQKVLAGSILNANKLTVDTNGVSSALKRQYPELSVVSVSLPLVGHRPIIYVAPADPALLYESNGGVPFVVDTNGRAIAQPSTTSVAKLHLPLVKDDGATSIHAGQLAVSSETVAFVRQVLYQAQQKQLTVTAFEMPSDASELDMYLDGQKYFVKFNVANNTPLEQVGDYLAVRHYLQSRGVTPSDYVDVRIPGRAYYK